MRLHCSTARTRLCEQGWERGQGGSGLHRDMLCCLVYNIATVAIQPLSWRPRPPQNIEMAELKGHVTCHTCTKKGRYSHSHLGPPPPTHMHTPLMCYFSALGTVGLAPALPRCSLAPTAGLRPSNDVCGPWQWHFSRRINLLADLEFPFLSLSWIRKLRRIQLRFKGRRGDGFLLSAFLKGVSRKH